MIAERPSTNLARKIHGGIYSARTRPNALTRAPAQGVVK